MNDPKEYLRLGDWNAYCDSCKFKFKASELKKDWKGYFKCPTCWETRHPMDLQQAPRPSKPIPWTRPSDERISTTSVSDVAIPGSPATPGNSLPVGTFVTNNGTL